MLITPAVLISRSGVALAIQPSRPQASRLICLDILLIAELVQSRCRRPDRWRARQHDRRRGPRGAPLAGPGLAGHTGRAGDLRLWPGRPPGPAGSAPAGRRAGPRPGAIGQGPFCPDILTV